MEEPVLLLPHRATATYQLLEYSSLPSRNVYLPRCPFTYPQNTFKMHPSSKLLKPLTFRDAMETHLDYLEDGTLFRLPDEILSLIVENLIDSGVDFRPLALLSPSFRQLARTVLFRAVTFSWRQGCNNGFLTFLSAEAWERLQNRRIKGQTQKPSIGACVRKVDLDIYYIPDGMTFRWDQLHDTSAVGRTVANFETYHDPLIHQVISSLPKLEAIEISGATFSQSLLNSLVGSTARSVKLCARMPAICPRIRLGVCWPITSLRLNVFEDEEVLSRTLYWECILPLCAPTLQDLTISSPSSTMRELSFNLNFPDLVYLDISRANLSRRALESLLLTSRKLHHLRADCTRAEVREVMNTPNEFHALRILSLHWNKKAILEDIHNRPLSFIANLGAVTNFEFNQESPPDLSEQILEELNHFRFHKLESLLLNWSVACDARPLIKKLSERDNTSLEKLHLASDEFFQGAGVVPFLMDPRYMQVLGDSCRWLKHLELVSYPRQLPDPDTVRERAEQIAGLFTNLESIRLWPGFLSSGYWRWAFFTVVA